MHKVLLVGNPNAGKTTLFNLLTQSDEHVGNWHGVTVDAKSKNVDFGVDKVQVVDTPGIYSLKAMSLEEEVSIREILQNNQQNITTFFQETQGQIQASCNRVLVAQIDNFFVVGVFFI